MLRRITPFIVGWRGASPGCSEARALAAADVRAAGIVESNDEPAGSEPTNALTTRAAYPRRRRFGRDALRRAIGGEHLSSSVSHAACGRVTAAPAARGRAAAARVARVIEPDNVRR